MKKSRVALHGFVYSNNFGDMLLATIANRIVHRHNRHHRVSLPFSTETFRAASGLTLDSGWQSFLNSDALLYHGGGYFAFSPFFQWRTRLRLFNRFYTPGLTAALLRKPYGIFGVGVGPIHSGAQRCAVSRVFENASIITVRDEESYDWLRRIGVRNGAINEAADLALTLTPEDIPEEAVAEVGQLLAAIPAERYIGLHLSAPSSMSPVYKAAMEGVITYVERHPELGIVVFCDHVAPHAGAQTPQYRASRELVERIGRRVLFLEQPPMWTLVALLARLDGLITNKLHTGIVSSAFGHRVVSIAKNDKNFRFFKQIDLPSQCIRIADVQSIDVPALLETSFEALHVARPLPQDLRQRAGRNEIEMRSFLNSVTGAAA